MSYKTRQKKRAMRRAEKRARGADRALGEFLLRSKRAAGTRNRGRTGGAR